MKSVLATLMHLLRIDATRSLFHNCAISLFLYLALVFSGGLWGIGALYVYFAIETALRGQGEGVVAAGFLPLIMVPWAVAAVAIALKVLDGWIEVLTSDREGRPDSGDNP